jgi:CheY-like chemotaxis protein
LQNETHGLQDSGEGDALEHRSIGTDLIHRLFDRHRVPERKRSKRVQEVLEISYQSAHRRVHGDHPWQLGELERVAAAYGESLADLVQSVRMRGAVEATFVIGAFRCPCKASLGGPTNRSRPTTLVAHEDGGQWFVTPPGDSSAASMSVESVTLEPMAKPRFKVAIVDDEQETVSGACAYLSEVGFEAHPFLTFSALREGMQRTTYDAYLLDWWVGSETALDTISAIRVRDLHCPIGVLTGQISTGRLQPTDVAHVIQNFRVSVPFEKPLRGPILAAWLHQALSQTPE